MIEFTKFRLDNGLRVLVHEDRSTPLVAMNILYDVGSRDEDPQSTGLAHLFEHLMFSGTPRIPEYDKHLELAGGENNAFTNSDITNYYISIPAQNIETGFWLESDRMQSIDFSERNLEVQKKVVTEEYNQRYLNQPYGDAMLLLRPLAYTMHPYKWPVIGSDIAHIEKTTINEIKRFFFSYYAPNNAILSVTGNISTDKVFKLAEKWFGSVKKRQLKQRDLPVEPLQIHKRILQVEREVPSSAIYMAWHMCRRNDPDFMTLDLITDLLSEGESGRLYTKLIKKEKLFSEISAYLTSDIDPGLIILHGKLMNGIEPEHAGERINEVINELTNKYAPASEIEKVKNKFEASAAIGNLNILNKAFNLAYFELLGNPGLVNKQVELYRKTNRDSVIEISQKYFRESNCSTIYYKSSGRNRQ
ncbi:MAG TPA: pitrilysin family protein [Bacteroidales bacterium]|nr:pitrilysin family protein [Bacteroidales bacterium]